MPRRVCSRCNLHYCGLATNVLPLDWRRRLGVALILGNDQMVRQTGKIRWRGINSLAVKPATALTINPKDQMAIHVWHLGGCPRASRVLPPAGVLPPVLLPPWAAILLYMVPCPLARARHVPQHWAAAVNEVFYNLEHIAATFETSLECICAFRPYS